MSFYTTTNANGAAVVATTTYALTTAHTSYPNWNMTKPSLSNSINSNAFITVTISTDKTTIVSVQSCPGGVCSFSVDSSKIIVSEVSNTATNIVKSGSGTGNIASVSNPIVTEYPTSLGDETSTSTLRKTITEKKTSVSASDVQDSGTALHLSLIHI